VPRRKGISPVIATVIIVAVTIAVAIAVAFWMTGIIGLFTGAVEKLEIVSATATPQAGGGGWQITIVARNTGTTQTTIDSLFINGILAATRNPGGGWQAGNVQCLANGPNFDPTGSDVLRPGDSTTITFDLNAGDCGTFNAQSGVSIEVKLHTSGGKEYPKLLTLP
jgi:flagellin-like protein